VSLAEIKWVRNLLQEIHVAYHTPKIYSDNLGPILLVANPIINSKPKYFDLDLHFVRDSFQQKDLQLLHIAGHKQFTDLLTNLSLKLLFISSWLN